MPKKKKETNALLIVLENDMLKNIIIFRQNLSLTEYLKKLNLVKERIIIPCFVSMAIVNGEEKNLFLKNLSLP